MRDGALDHQVRVVRAWRQPGFEPVRAPPRIGIDQIHGAVIAQVRFRDGHPGDARQVHQQRASNQQRTLRTGLIRERADGQLHVFAFVRRAEAGQLERPCGGVFGDAKLGVLLLQAKLAQGRLIGDDVAERDGVVIGARLDGKPSLPAFRLLKVDAKGIVVIADGAGLAGDRMPGLVGGRARLIDDGHARSEGRLAVEFETER